MTSHVATKCRFCKHDELVAVLSSSRLDVQNMVACYILNTMIHIRTCFVLRACALALLTLSNLQPDLHPPSRSRTAELVICDILHVLPQQLCLHK